MPSSTTIQQLVDDLRDRKSTIARAFDDVYDHCKGNNADRDTLVDELEKWEVGNKDTLPALQNYGADNLKDAEKEHICDWPDAGKVIKAMLNALTDGSRDIEFFWDLSDDLTPAAASHSDIYPAAAGNNFPDPGGAGENITVTFVTPRKKVKKAFATIGPITAGGVDLEV